MKDRVKGLERLLELLWNWDKNPSAVKFREIRELMIELRKPKRA